MLYSVFIPFLIGPVPLQGEQAYAKIDLRGSLVSYCSPGDEKLAVEVGRQLFLLDLSAMKVPTKTELSSEIGKTVVVQGTLSFDARKMTSVRVEKIIIVERTP